MLSLSFTTNANEFQIVPTKRFLFNFIFPYEAQTTEFFSELCVLSRKLLNASHVGTGNLYLFILGPNRKFPQNDCDIRLGQSHKISHEMPASRYNSRMILSRYACANINLQ